MREAPRPTRLRELIDEWRARAQRIDTKTRGRDIDEAVALQSCADELEAALAAREALKKVDGIRNTIIAHQNINWSRDIYPLVAALEEAGFHGEGYEVARQNALTLHQALDQATARADALTQRCARLTGYVQHKVGCATLCVLQPRPSTVSCANWTLGCWVDHSLGCTCGLDQSLKETP